PLPRFLWKVPHALSQHHSGGPRHDAAVRYRRNRGYQLRSLRRKDGERSIRTMKKISRRAWLEICGAATVASGLLALPSRQKISWASNLPREVIREHYFPNVLLTTHEGEQVRFYDDLIKDKLVT